MTSVLPKNLMQSNVSAPKHSLQLVCAILKSTRQRNRGLHLALISMTGAVALLTLLTVYLLAWGVVYRLPHEPSLIVDMRADKSGAPRYVAVCAALAANQHGFPGHAYAVWSESLPIDLNLAQSIGYVPSRGCDQIPSLWRVVPGMLVERAADDNQRNLNAVIAIVDQNTYENSFQKCKSFNSGSFKVGSSDCVAFANSIATDIGLKTSNPRFRYPQDYIEQLKSLNKTTTLPDELTCEIFINN
jgi:hypothetical protein